MSSQDLASVAKALVAGGKGILAADESTSTIEKRFKGINVQNTEDNRRAYRELLFTTAGAAEYISGVILYDETLRQSTSAGKSFVEVMRSQGVIPGIKVDKGVVALPGSPQEKITEGLDGLRGRLEEYRKLGAQFAKWRAVITIGNGIPTEACLDTNAHALARYAALCQEAGIVPIVEPEVLMDGNHDLQRCYQVTEAALTRVFSALHTQNVKLDGMLLKPNMVISGTECSRKASAEEIAEATVRCFRNTVPVAVPGIVFLSGGQSDEEATVNLNAIAKKAQGCPWALSFSYGRALQTGALKAWRGDSKNVAAGQKAYHHRARLNSAARFGKYSPEMERQV